MVILKLEDDFATKHGITTATDLVAKLEQPTSAPVPETNPPAAVPEAVAKTAEPVVVAPAVEANAEVKTSAEITADTATVESLKAEIVALKTTAKEEAQKATANAVAEAIATLGTSPLAIKSDEKPAAANRTALLAEFNAITDPKARSEFFQKHQSALLGGR